MPRRRSAISIMAGHFGGVEAMAIFDDREKGEEAKYARDQETTFKITARRNKLLGLWAAGEMGMTPTESEAYAKSVIVADLQEAGEEDVFRKVHSDMLAKGLRMTEEQLREKMAKLLDTAQEQIMKG